MAQTTEKHLEVGAEERKDGHGIVLSSTSPSTVITLSHHLHNRETCTLIRLQESRLPDNKMHGHLLLPRGDMQI